MFGGATALLLYTGIKWHTEKKIVYDLNQAACGALCGMVVITSGGWWWCGDAWGWWR